MPAGIINDISNLIGKTKRPHYFILILFLIFFILIYTERLISTKISTDPSIFHIAVGNIILFIFICITTITIASQLELGGHFMSNISKIFNASTSKNIIALFSFLFFVIFVYEVAEFDNNNPHAMTDNFLLGHNNIISNRTAGIVLIIFFGLFVGYTIGINSTD
jgi:hypothetical protein